MTGDQALVLAEDSMSTMVTTRLRELLSDTEPYRERPQLGFSANGRGLSCTVTHGALHAGISRSASDDRCRRA